MDPFAEKDLIDLLKSIALSMKEIKDELFDIKIAIRDLSLDGENDFEEDLDEEERKEGRLNNSSEEDVSLEEQESEKESVEKFGVSDEDAYIEIEPNKQFEEEDKLESDDEFKDDSEKIF